MLFSEPHKVPAWPLAFTSFDDVAAYLLDKRTVTIGSAIYGVDFYRPVPGSYAHDETAYTTDDPRTRFKFLLFGRLLQGPERQEGCHHFTLEGSHDLPAKLQRLYEVQLEVLSVPMLADDLTEDDIRVEHCTDSDRTTGKGGKVVDVRPLICSVHVEQNGQITERVQYPAAFPVAIGDWVLVEATLHLDVDRMGYYPRTYEVIAHHVRCLSTHPQPASPAAVDTDYSANDAEELPQAFAQSSHAQAPESNREVATPWRSAHQRFSLTEQIDTVATPKKRKRTAQTEDHPMTGVETRSRRRQRDEDSPKRRKSGKGKAKV
ncbi:hypothetical protein B0H13DRAFT_2345319 [Mycena leptocephala]|nr:hypothetical protein B0H13DRAFT_2345319 [Mycena leptocephala]